MNWRSGASEMVDLVNFQEQRFDHVMADKLEVGVPEMVHDVLFPSGEEVIYDDHAVSSRNQTVHEVGPYEPGSTCYDDSQTLPL